MRASCQPIACWPLEKTRALREPEHFSGECSLVLWAASPSGPQALTLGVGFLERVAGIHKAGSRIMLVLELQVQLGCLAESVSGTWNRKE